MDSELMGGVTEDPDTKGQFVSFILRPLTGENLYYQSYPSLDEAIFSINEVNRPWVFEPFGSGCGGTKCEKGSCDPVSCPAMGRC